MRGRHCLLACVCLLVVHWGARQAGAQIQALPPIAPEASSPIVLSDAPGVVDGYVSAPSPRMVPDVYATPGPPLGDRGPWSWQTLPNGLLYPNYLASARASRLGTEIAYESNLGWLWQGTLGGRAGLVRYGTDDPLWPEGWQLDVEAAANVRLNLEEKRDVESVDFQFGFPLTYRLGSWEAKAGFMHLSSHLGDEYMLREDGWTRFNYVRDSLVFGLAYRPTPDWRLYGEADWALFTHFDGAEPLHLQFGIDYSPVRLTQHGPDPFVAVNTRLQQENDFGGNITAETGLQWRREWGRLFRIGVYYFNGKSSQYQFFRLHEELIGVGMWYDY